MKVQLGRRTLLHTYLWPHRAQFGMLAVLLLVGIALQLTGPLLLRSFIDQASSQRALGEVITTAILFIAVMIVSQIATVSEGYVAEKLAWLTTNALRADTALHCLRLDLSFHQAHPPGTLIERIDGDASLLANFFSRFVVVVIGNGLLLVGMLLILIGVDWRVGVPLTLYTCLALLILHRLRHVSVPHWDRARQANADLFGFMEERLTAAEDIRTAGAVPFMMRRLAEHLRQLLRTERPAALLGTTLLWSQIMLVALGTVLALGIIAYLYTRGVITIGSAYLVFAYTQMLQQPLMQITGQLGDYQKAAAGVRRLQELRDLMPTIADNGTGALPSGPLSVELRQVSVAYQPDQPVLRDLSLDIPPGQVLGVLGRTGSGKSTLARLLCRLHEPAHGTISLGGVNIRTVPLSAVRRAVGVVTQDVQLFHASLRDNLTLFDPHIADRSITAALERLGLGAWYRALADGLDTRLAGSEQGLSTGQAQILGLTRIFLRDPGLVILDEASSHLDPATERLVDQAIRELLVGRTGIIIAHRLTTVLRADMILILNEGQVEEYGSRATLLANPNSRLSQLCRSGGHEVIES